MGKRLRVFGLGPEGALAIVLTFAVALAYLAVRDTPSLQALEGRTLDWRFRVRGPLPPSPDIVLVTLDDRSLEALGRWPVSRAWLARALEAVAADGASVVAFDLLFIGAEDDPAADEALRRAIEATGRVVVPFAFTFAAETAEAESLPPAIARSAYAVVQRPATASAAPGLRPRGVLAPAEDLLAAGNPAHVSVFLDADGVLRRTLAAVAYGGAYYPALYVVAARLFLGLAPSDVVLRLGEELILGERRIAIEADMRLPLNPLGPAGHFSNVALIDVVEGRAAPGTFRDRIVLIGATAQGVGDRFVTPFGQNVPGVEVFATALDNVLEARTPERSLRTMAWDLAAIFAAGFLVAALAWQSAALVTLLAGLGLIVLWAAASTAALILANIWLSFIFPAAAAGVGIFVVAAAQNLRERRGRRGAERDRSALARYVSPLVDTRADKAGAVQEAAVMFVDLRGFTAVSEDLSPEQTMQLLRDFHRRVEVVVTRHHGKIDKYIGDGVLIVFGAGQADPADAGHAIACARGLSAAMSAWSDDRAATGAPSIRVAIGAHFGPVMLGEVGGDSFAQMTVTGDTVNVASRLETLTRSHGVTILASSALVAAARGTGAPLDGFVELPPQDIRGRRQPLGVWAWPAPKL